MFETILKGAMLSGGLIVAIGSQNIFVLRQGLLGRNIFYVSLVCFLCDFMLMSIGVMGLGAVISSSNSLMSVLSLIGAVFLYFYGFFAFKRSFLGGSYMKVYSNDIELNRSVAPTVLAALAITLLNPHVYLDTVVIVGGIAGTLNPDEKIWFLIGSLLASFVWFFGLGYGARLLVPLFKKESTWRLLDLLVGVVMFWIATELFVFAMGFLIPIVET